MVGHQVLVLGIGVRIPVPEQNLTKRTQNFLKKKVFLFFACRQAGFETVFSPCSALAERGFLNDFVAQITTKYLFNGIILEEK